ncbi:MAG: DNA methylase, partial [Clostridiales bacterium]|nr:DNA methylase [Clostridiales bacterium]
YPYEKVRLIAREMTDLLALDLVDKKLVTDQIVLTLGYDAQSLRDPAIRKAYRGEVTTDHYGRPIPRHAHGTVNLEGPTASSRLLTDAVTALFERIADPTLLVKRVNVTANHVVDEGKAAQAHAILQLDLFTDYAAVNARRESEKAMLEREKKTQQAMLAIKRKLGKNAIIKGMNLEEGATTLARNAQIGGHKA